jgi:hypothetical protein
MSNDRAGKSKFRGFRSPNYTQVPDELFDELLPELSGAELKVLLYIIRRTFGFKRDRDSISLSQMLNGVHSRNGDALDRGAGVSKPTLLQALRSLEDRGIIETERRRSAERGDEPTVYMLRFADDREGGQKQRHPLVNKLDQGGGQESLPPPWSKNLTTQETVLQETDLDLSNFEGSHDHVDNENVVEAAADGTRRLMPLGEILKRRAAGSRNGATGEGITEPVDETPPRRRGQAAGDLEERERLRAFLEDFARELGDEAPLSSTITRTLKIFKTAGVPPAQWSDYLYRCRGLTQEHTAQIRKLAGDGGSGMRRKNKMPYFLATLEQLVGLRPDPAARGGRQDRGRSSPGT